MFCHLTFGNIILAPIKVSPKTLITFVFYQVEHILSVLHSHYRYIQGLMFLRFEEAFLKFAY